MSDTNAAVAKLITQILSVNSPEPGARLKQRLKLAFRSSGYGDFNEKSLGFNKFTDYLLHQHGDLVEVVRPTSSGDVSVYLRSGSAPLNTQKTKPALRNDLWQAFVNPDPNRLRFFDRETGTILHFLSDKPSPEREEYEKSQEKFLEIKPISGEEQKAWMKEFIDNQELTVNEAVSLQAIISEKYSSEANALFIRMLGSHSISWKIFRASKVKGYIQTWVEQYDVKESLLYRASAPVPGGENQKYVSLQKTESKAITARDRVIKLMELLSDEDISQLVLPTILSTILIRSRL